MNLHGIVGPAVGAVNPPVWVTISTSNGYTTNPDGSRVPNYVTIHDWAQIQALQFTDITQLEGLNIQGVRRAMYFSRDVAGIIRVNQKGGDLITLPDGTVWLAAVVLEHWPDWTKVAVTLQDGS